MASKKATFTRLAAAGNIAAVPAGLSSLTVDNPTGGALAVKLNNAISGTGSDVLQVTVPANDFRHLNFSPPLDFSVGIRCGTLADGLIVTGGYVL